jgi:hypothetical protein
VESKHVQGGKDIYAEESDHNQRHQELVR